MGDGSIITTKGTKLGVAIRFDDEVVVVRQRNDTETIPEYAVASVELKAPSHRAVSRGDRDLKRKAGDALASFTKQRRSRAATSSSNRHGYVADGGLIRP